MLNNLLQGLLPLGSFLIITLPLIQALGDHFDYPLEDYKNHPCVRPCEDGAPPRVCKYQFLVENYYVLSKACHDCPFNQSQCSLPHCVSADGVPRGIKTANRMMPGPGIHVCEGDTVEVTVDNRLDSAEGTSIHWHGLLQKNTPYMDGVSMVTQCPITYHSKFTYKFVAKDPGTHYWHGHSGVQRADGLYGSFIVRRPPSREPHYELYDHDLPDHVIFVTDWTKDIMTVNKLAKYTHYDFENSASLMLINGMGQYAEFKDSNNGTHFTPRASFTVEPIKRYRFRVISAGVMNCAIQFSIDGHTMQVIASDGNAVKPFTTESFTIYPGERIDFVLYAYRLSPLRNYWIRARGYGNCEKYKTTQTAILKYQSAPDELPPETTTWEDGKRLGVTFNSALATGSAAMTEMTDMISLDPDDDIVTSQPDRKYYMAVDYAGVENLRSHHPEYYSIKSDRRFYSPHINWISSQVPASPPLSQLDDIPKDMFCNAETVQKDCKKEWCACVHLYPVDLGDLVEIIVVDEGVMAHAYHPMHLHGHKFRVLGMGRLNTSASLEEIKEMDRKGELKRTTSKAPIKDTIIVPDGGYTILRFRADNPGFWLFHCHVEFHAEHGMAMVFQVGTPSQIPPVPKNFPRCGDFSP